MFGSFLGVASYFAHSGVQEPHQSVCLALDGCGWLNMVVLISAFFGVCLVFCSCFHLGRVGSCAACILCWKLELHFRVQVGLPGLKLCSHLCLPGWWISLLLTLGLMGLVSWFGFLDFEDPWWGLHQLQVFGVGLVHLDFSLPSCSFVLLSLPHFTLLSFAEPCSLIFFLCLLPLLVLLFSLPLIL